MIQRVLLQSVEMWPIAVIGLALSALLVWKLYLPQTRMLAAPWRRTLLLLRFAGLAVLLVAVLKPVVVRPRSGSERGAVVFLIDSSASMGVIDAPRDGASLVAVARGIGLLPESAGAGVAPAESMALQRLASATGDAVFARTQLEYARLSARDITVAESRWQQARQTLESASTAAGGDAATGLLALARDSSLPGDDWIRRAVAASSQARDQLTRLQLQANQSVYDSDESVRTKCEIVNSMSRLELACRALAGQDGLLAKVGADAAVFGFAFAGRTTAIPLQTREGWVGEVRVRPDGAATSVTAALAAVRETFARQPLQAIVLMSDGRQTAGDLSIASAVAGLGAPVYVIDPTGTPGEDVSLSDVLVSSSVFAGEQVPVRAQVRLSGAQARPVRVTLTAGQQRLTRTVQVPSNAAAEVEFAVILNQAGVTDVCLEADALPGERVLANNSAARTIKVLPGKLRVTVVSGSARWDDQYIRNALSRAGWAELREHLVVSRDKPLPMSPREILAQQVIVLSDVSFQSLSADQWDAVNRVVGELGGSVIVIAGEQSAMAGLSTAALTSSLLPFHDPRAIAWRRWNGDAPQFRFAPAPHTDVLRLSDDPDESARRWSELPALFGHLPVTGMRAGVTALLVERDSEAPVLTRHHLGIGNCFFVGLDQTWRWRYRVGERDQDRFWLQLVRGAVEVPYAFESPQVAFDVDPVVIEPGKPVTLRARLRNDDGTPRTAREVVVEIHRDGNLAASHAMATPPGAPTGRYLATPVVADPGDYTVHLRVDGVSVGQALPLRVEHSSEAEMANLRSDPGRLARIASLTGGQVLPLERAAEVPSLIREVARRQPQVVEYPVWSSGFLYAFVVGCFGLEWALRKRFGLA